MLHELPKIYDGLWDNAVSAWEQNQIQVDPHLENQSKDLRRGVTILLRPYLPIQLKIIRYLHSLSDLLPGQHFYQPEELHVTVLSIISGTESWRNEIRQLAACRQLINAVLRHQTAFKIRFQGITASPGSIMIQGFPLNDSLMNIRNQLRATFTANGLGNLLDRRYKISTAHITAARFKKSLTNPNQLIERLRTDRRIHFGTTEIHQLQLVWGDWYASSNIARTLQEYHLEPTASR